VSEVDFFACMGLVAVMGVVGGLLRLELDTGRGRVLLLLTVVAVVGATAGFR
jgi:hypothetical protein